MLTCGSAWRGQRHAVDDSRVAGYCFVVKSFAVAFDKTKFIPFVEWRHCLVPGRPSLALPLMLLVSQSTMVPIEENFFDIVSRSLRIFVLFSKIYENLLKKLLTLALQSHRFQGDDACKMQIKHYFDQCLHIMAKVYR
jgi:hypothetical protein